MSNKHPSSFALHRLDLKGDPYEIGLALGQFGAAGVHGYLLGSPIWANVQKAAGSEAARRMASLTQHHFPAVWAELEGLAQGLALPLEAVFLWNARGEIWGNTPDGCTSVMQAGTVVQRISHNEDGDPGFAGYCGIAQCAASQGASFASFVYPGSLPGHTLAVNEHGLAIAVNNIRALAITAGLPRMVVTRALLNASHAQEAVDILKSVPLSAAFHLNIGESAAQLLLSVEFSSHYCSIQPVKQMFAHANHAIHAQTRDWPQVITGSSGHRQQRCRSLLACPDKAPLDILADQAHARFPVYRRQADDPDRENTLATADIFLHPDRVCWTVYEHLNQPPRFRLRNAQFTD